MCDECLHSPCPPACPNFIKECVCLCRECGREIYDGEIIYDLAGEIWCDDCVNECRTEAQSD